MSDASTLEALQAFHRELIAVSEHRLDNLQLLDPLLAAHADRFKSLVDKEPRKQESRRTVESGKIVVGDEEYSVNKEFQESILQLADELDLDEIQAAQLLLDSEDDVVTLGRPLLECGLIRFHQQRKFVLDCMRLCILLADDQDLDPAVQAIFGDYVTESIYGAALPEQPALGPEKRIVPRCMIAMQEIRTWLQKLTDRATAASVLQEHQPAEVKEMFDFSRMSLIQQHEGLSIVLLSAVEKRQAEARDFEDLLKLLQRLDRYDCLLLHLFPTLACYIRIFGSPDGVSNLAQARRLNEIVNRREDDGVWQMPSLRAAICAWWIAEYSGWYMDDIDVSLDNIDVDKEDKERADTFSECLKEGALDFILAVSSDVEIRDWQDPTPSGVQVWIQRKCPPLPTDSVSFADHFRIRVLEQLENFVDAFISNLPDVIRQLRIEEDEQRQLSQMHEQSLELERFLLIISSAYEGRPEAAEAFWADPESNLAGFMQWASHRASTPLVSAFCEMLRSISGNEASAEAAHDFLLDEINSSSNTGRIRKSQSLTWVQVVKELEFFTARIRAHTSPAPALTYRGGKPSDDQEEAEPESAIMLECYLRLIARISSNSYTARMWLLQSKDFSLVGVLFQLASLPVPGPLRARIFTALKALLSEKSLEISYIMWNCLDDYMSGAYVQHTQQMMPVNAPTPSHYMEGFLSELTQGFEQPYAFVQFLLALVVPARDQSPLNDALPFPENYGAAMRMPGIDPYVDFVLNTVLGKHIKELENKQQQQALRLSSLDFALACLETFNEDLLLIANETALPVDSAIATTDLAAYVKLHPFARVMEWMYSHNVVESIFKAIPEDTAEIGGADPDSPLILGIIRAVQLVSKILDLQDTYLDLVRQLIRLKVGDRRKPVSSAYSFFEEAISNRLDVVVNLGSCCGLGHPTLTLACLKLLEKVSVSPKVISAWNPGPGQHARRNKAIVALEKDGEASAISGAFISEMIAPLDPGLEAESPNYSIKTFMLDFLHSCLQASPNKPTIAHLILGFRCGIDALSVESGGAFDDRTSLFHNLLRVLLEAPFGDDELGMRHWLILLKHKIMRIFQVLWRSPLSSAIVLSDLRENDFAFHLLIREVTLQQDLPWDGLSTNSPEFITTDASIGFIEFWAVRAMTLEYIGIELCSVSQNRMPSLKRRIFDALNGQVVNDSGEPISTPTVFELYDFMSSNSSSTRWETAPPPLKFLQDLDLRASMDETPYGETLYDLDKARELALLKAAEIMKESQFGERAFEELREEMQREEVLMLEYLSILNRQKQLANNHQIVLQSWAKLLLVMFEANEFSGTAQVSFLLQALQAILPGLEAASTENPVQAFELAKLAEALLFKLGSQKSGNNDFNASEIREGRQMSSLVSDKLFQLFQICLHAVCKWVGSPELRAVYYNICYRHVAGLIDSGNQGDGDNAETYQQTGMQRASKAVDMCGERVLNVICDDAYSSDSTCQAAALILLGSLVRLGEHEKDTHVVELLNRLNFIGVLVDSLRTTLQDGLAIIQSGSLDQKMSQDAKLALLLQLCQTRDGAKFVLHANLFRAIELSGLFAADPELQVDPANTAALTQHYELLVKTARVVGAAIVSRGSHNVQQGRRFLAEHRMLVMHVLKRSAGIGAVSSRLLDEMVEELAEAFMVLIVATNFLEFEDQAPVQPQKTPARVAFH
ncbi:nuclear pore complex subunit [Grosmannia clavigera kw1407]|uniref:Nuclear pore complex subunit n=1 Tax=Grosmannia clavigera (strain kw1407 / UAMH 11150) TaxID=655863 RepID=F0XS94_GROCL|nr:nuclear pore complex subunit [Grosmannia clavigera kw1407]EFW99544.1 nuclear pore complex subunit [Grosmannia clavigera kw1407]